MSTETTVDKKPQVETLLSDVFRLMNYPVRFDYRDMADGSLGVAVHFDGEVPGVHGQKRSHLIDSVQFWVNKAVNRPNMPRRWVNLAANAFPEPRSPKIPSESTAAPANTEKPSAPKSASTKSAAPVRKSETKLAPAMLAAAKELALKSNRHGRYYAVLGLTDDDATSMAQSAQIPGVTVVAEGEGHCLRLTYKPAKPAAIAKREVMPDIDAE